MKYIVQKLLIALAYIYLKLKPHFEKAQGVVLLRKIESKGSNCHFEGGGILIDPKKFNIGNDVYIGRNFFIRASGGVEIGSYTHISRNVTIHTVNHNINSELLPYDKTTIQKPIRIGKYVWIGMNCSILPGVTIGDGAVIGMNTVVVKDVNPGEIVVGSSHRVVGTRDGEKTRELVLKDKFLKLNKTWSKHV